MGSYVKSIHPVIKSKYDSFSQAEKAVADFFLNNREKMDFSAKNIANRLFVSQSALSRFAKKCGFSGYREFIYQYMECFSFSEGAKTASGHVQNILNIYQEILNSAYNLVDEAQILRIIKFINETESLFVCGRGSSALAAREMESRLMRIGVNIDSEEDVDRMRMRTVFQGKNKMVMGISLSGENAEILYVLRESHKKGAKTVLLTANNKDLLHKFCDEVVLVPSLKHLSSGNIISPQFPILIFIDILYYYYLRQDRQEKEILHGSTLQTLNDGKKQGMQSEF